MNSTKKTCPKCSANVGAEKWRCAACGHLFEESEIEYLPAASNKDSRTEAEKQTEHLAALRAQVGCLSWWIVGIPVLLFLLWYFLIASAVRVFR